jgi:hypothetical protein
LERIWLAYGTLTPMASAQRGWLQLRRMHGVCIGLLVCIWLTRRQAEKLAASFTTSLRGVGTLQTWPSEQDPLVPEAVAEASQLYAGPPGRDDQPLQALRQPTRSAAKRQYTQDLLELFAEALQCEPADLIIRDPSDPAGIWSISGISSRPVERAQVVEIAKTLKRTGTEG